ncbi:hypothetical protein MSAN_00326000 [Mycena sanguinolenta]|uniref:Uncharacterized protein n=1 Tax=Mycena sanguinolenta TaxID=230812 RepID=A0A8H6ZBW3_9AGAR|nr:hypothetical protein MSAN_00326000 [Mycena sanguinolenta]
MAYFYDVLVQKEFKLSFGPTENAANGYKYRWNGAYCQYKQADSPLVDGTPLNQTTFIHAFAISVGHRIWEKLFGVEVCQPVDSSTFMDKSGGSFIPYGPQGSSFMWFSFSGNGTSSGGKQYSSPAPALGNGIVTDAFPAPKIIHPSQIIHELIFREVPEATVVITHDDDWCDLFKDDDMQTPGQTASELQQAVLDRFEILEENGMAFLSAKSHTNTLKNTATMSVEEQLSTSVGGHITNNLRNDTSLLFQIDPNKISSSSRLHEVQDREAQDRNYTAERHLQPLCSDSILLHVQNPTPNNKDSSPAEFFPVPESDGENSGLSSSHIRSQRDGEVSFIETDSDSSPLPLLSLACRFLPHDQWFTTHVDPDWKVKQVKSWLLGKCLPYAAPASPPPKQSARKLQRSSSPRIFAPDPRHRPISPTTFAMPNQKVAPKDASEFEEPLIMDLSEPESQQSPEEILPRIQPPKKRTILPTASTSAKGDLYSQYTLIRFSTGQLLEDDLPLSFYDMQANELLELHRVSIIVTLPRAHPTRYLDAYWEGHVRVLRMKPLDDEEDSYPLYKVRQLETRALEWRERWLVVREGSIHLCRDERRQTRLIHTLSLADLVQLTNTGVPPSAASSSKARVILAHFSPASSFLVSTRASSPINPFDSDSDSSSDLSSPIFAHDSSDSNRPRRKLHRRVRKRPDPEYLILDLKDDAAYVSLLRVLHRHALPRSTFVDKLPVGIAESPQSALPDNEVADDDALPSQQQPPSAAHLRIPLRGLSLGALPFPEWRTNVLQRARRAGLGRIDKAVEWVLWNGETAEDPARMLDSISSVRSRRRRRRHSPVKRPTSSEGYDPDLSSDASPSLSDNGEDDSDSENAGVQSETGVARVAMEERARAAAREEARRLAEEELDAVLELPPLPPGRGGKVTIARVGTGVDDRIRREALEPSALVTSLSSVNHLSQANLDLLSQGPPSLSSGTSYSESLSVVSEPAAPAFSSLYSTKPFAFAPPTKLADAEAMPATTSWVRPPDFAHTHSVPTADPKGLPRMASQQTFSTPQTPLTEQVADPAVPVKKRELARGMSIRAERFVKSLDSALDFVDGR